MTAVTDEDTLAVAIRVTRNRDALDWPSVANALADEVERLQALLLDCQRADLFARRANRIAGRAIDALRDKVRDRDRLQRMEARAVAIRDAADPRFGHNLVARRAADYIVKGDGR